MPDHNNHDAKVCIIIPAYNEEALIELCLKETREAFPSARILVIDNNSTDQTAAIAMAAGGEVILETQKGKGFAVTTGVRMALEQGYDWVVLHDADREYSAEHLAQLVQRCLVHSSRIAGAPLIMGVGLREVMLGRVLWRSVIANFIARFALRMSAGTKPPEDILTGARVFNLALARKLFLDTIPTPYRGFELETAVTRQAMRHNAHIVSGSVRYVPRVAGEKKIKATDLFGILKAAFRG